MGDGILGWAIRIISVLWVSTVVVILALPTIRPVIPSNMNYASAVTLGVIAIATLCYLGIGRKIYRGPRNVLLEEGITTKAVTGDDDLVEVK